MAEKPEGAISEKRQDGGEPRPWEAAGMSRASWYRHGKPRSNPERHTQRDIAKLFGTSLRTVQRAYTIMRRERRKAVQQAMREAGFNGPPFDSERIQEWLGQHSDTRANIDDLFARHQNIMLEKLDRGARPRDWQRIADMMAEHPKVTRWVVTTVDGQPRELEAMTYGAVMNWLTERTEPRDDGEAA